MKDTNQPWNAAITAALEKIPGGSHCDPQELADEIRKLMKRPEPQPEPHLCGAQDDADWEVFADLFEAQRGFPPHPRDSLAMDRFHWFTVGVRSERLGRTNTPRPA